MADEMSLNKAKAIVALAIENETLEGDVPTVDANILSEAQGLVDNAILAWGKNIRGPEVESLLMLDASFDDMTTEEQEAAVGKFKAPEPEPEDKSNPFAKGAKAKTEETPAPEPDPEPEPEAPAGSQPEGDRVVPTAAAIEAAKEAILTAAKDGDPDEDPDYYDPEGDEPPFPDYDKVKVADFKSAFANEWDAEQIAVVQLYEASHKGRPGIVNWTPDKAAPVKAEETPADPPADDQPTQEQATPAALEGLPVTGSFVVTREQILEALGSGSVTISV